FTIVDGIRVVKPGCFAQTSGAAARFAPYWTLSQVHSNGADGGAVRDAVQSAIASELEADVPVGVFLSGGIDSSAIVAAAAATRAKPVHTFTVTFDEDAYNEAAFAERVARRFGCEHHNVHLTAGDAYGQVDNVLESLDQPSADG